jgi:hypothetical protein
MITPGSVERMAMAAWRIQETQASVATPTRA